MLDPNNATEKPTSGDVLLDARIKAKIVADELQKLSSNGVLVEWSREVYDTLRSIRRAEFFK